MHLSDMASAFFLSSPKSTLIIIIVAIKNEKINKKKFMDADNEKNAKKGGIFLAKIKNGG